MAAGENTCMGEYRTRSDVCGVLHCPTFYTVIFMNTRQEGYYWVKVKSLGDTWVVAEWEGYVNGGAGWWIPGDSSPCADYACSEINENRIPAPDEPVVNAEMYLNLQKSFADSGLPIPADNSATDKPPRKNWDVTDEAANKLRDLLNSHSTPQSLVVSQFELRHYPKSLKSTLEKQ
jgi:hypothetical protein